MKNLLAMLIVIFSCKALLAQEDGPETKVHGVKNSEAEIANAYGNEAQSPEVVCKSGNKFKGYQTIIKIIPLNDSKTLLATVVKQSIQNKNLDVMPTIKPMIAPLEVTRTQKGVARDYNGNGFHLHIPLESFIKTKTHNGTLVLNGKETKIGFSCTDQY